jgi:hypothetical protein
MVKSKSLAELSAKDLLFSLTVIPFKGIIFW